ncbi:glycosyl hydrolase family 18 [Sanguibacter keddieii DSM 10542]|uniref:Glycosyl hydrolase family 18 n=1 Tax=Sanguibacter keddieii (strain ATCC 51767 / DSM 10542 / NCFB 3025 / ST-74) TaxID=446469 RepID=D1BF93_SANKS|nr:endo-beta-N-acetylglucosaminidase H [Sanguibacter keddieii]ACZ21389.1 glycosyl hydrolase family 18 [Sanguibacter keddieii DSM 10542]
MSRTHERRHPARRAIAAATAMAAAAALGTVAALPAAAAPEPGARSSSDPVSIAYVEVNSNELANVGKYELADGSNAFDVAIIFAANINHDGTAPYLHLNDQVQATLDAADTQIKPLQDMGIKVTLSLLGNHQAAGFANFPTQASAEAFADEVADVVQTYGLDGVDIDDEWVTYGSGGTPAVNPSSAAWLVDALHEKLPADSLITLYDIGATSTSLQQAPTSVVDKLDYIWNPYYGQYNPPQFDLDRSRLGAAAVDLGQTPVSTATNLAARTVADGYGAFVTYDLRAGDASSYLSAITRELYGQDTVYTG